MEFASSLKIVGWFFQMLFDKSLTATVQLWAVIADNPDFHGALRSLSEELNRVQAMLSFAQNLPIQNEGLIKDLMEVVYDAEDLISELDYYRLEQQVNNSEDLLRKIDYLPAQKVNDAENLLKKVDYLLDKEVNVSEDLLSKVDHPLEQQENDSENPSKLQLRPIEESKASTSSTPPSSHDDNKATVVPRIHQIISRLGGLVTHLIQVISLLKPEEGLCTNPNVFPVASHHVTTSFLSSDKSMSLSSRYRDTERAVLPCYELLSMFNKCAFGSKDPSDHSELVDIANQIARKLKGSSLAAKIVGGLLRDNLDEQHWRSVLCSDIWQQQWSPDDIMPIFRFSYRHLPAHLQQCFAYCGVFPKNQWFKKEHLVGMWISQGYIHTKSQGNMSPEEIGREYFDNLLSKSFIQVRNEYGRKSYVLHPLFHDLAESVSEDECLRINPNGTNKITSRVRHIYTDADNLGLLKSCNLRNLRTLIIDGSIGNDNNVLQEVLIGLKSVRVLSLKNVSVQLLSGSIRHLIHLRYLTVRANYQNMQLDSQCRPYHLQWLIFETDSKGPTHFVLPATMNCLVSLRHLMTGIEKMYGIGKLTHLQELESFTVGNKEGQKLGELKRLNELGGTLKLLSIQYASTKEEALEANLDKKIGIRELKLSCSGSHVSTQMAEEVFEGLHPPPYIKKLTLNGYIGVKSPSWMVTENHCLSYLQSLCLSNCSTWKVLPTLGKLPLLKHLEINGAHSVEEIGSSFYGSGVAKAFPCLDTLQFIDMPELVVWSGVEVKYMSEPVVSSRGKDTCPAFPLLRELKVTDCRRLQQVPIQYMATVEVLKTNSLLLLAQIEHLTSLRELFFKSRTELVAVPLLPKTLECLHISGMEMLTAFSVKQEEYLSDLTCLRKLYISDCHLRTLPIMPASLQQLSIQDISIDTDCLLLLENLTSLRELFIQRCTKFMSVDLKRLSSLEKLDISFCSSIKSVPLLPPTLKWLKILRLKMLTAFSMEQEENLSDLTSLREVTIYECPNLCSLPIMPASLQKLYIEKCPGLTRERYQKGGDDWHKISHVPTIYWY